MQRQEITISLTNFRTWVHAKSETTAYMYHSRSQDLMKLSILTRATAQKIHIQCSCQILILMAPESTVLVSLSQ